MIAIVGLNTNVDTDERGSPISGGQMRGEGGGLFRESVLRESMRW